MPAHATLTRPPAPRGTDNGTDKRAVSPAPPPRPCPSRRASAILASTILRGGAR